MNLLPDVAKVASPMGFVTDLEMRGLSWVIQAVGPKRPPGSLKKEAGGSVTEKEVW